MQSANSHIEPEAAQVRENQNCAVPPPAGKRKEALWFLIYWILRIKHKDAPASNAKLDEQLVKHHEEPQ